MISGFKWNAHKEPMTGDWTGEVKFDIAPGGSAPGTQLAVRATGKSPADALFAASTAARQAAQNRPVAKKAAKRLSLTRLISNPLTRKLLTAGLQAATSAIPGGGLVNTAASLLSGDGPDLGDDGRFAREMYRKLAAAERAHCRARV